MSMSGTNLQKPKYIIHLIYASAIFLAVAALIGYDMQNQEQAASCIDALNKKYNTYWARH